MSIVVGIAPSHCSASAVQLAVMLARTYRQPLVVASINSAAWPTNFARGRVDSEYQVYVQQQAQEALERARASVPHDIEATYLVRDVSSSRRGLLDVCEEFQAIRLVVGAKHESAEGEIGLGSVVTGLLQSSPVPVAIAPLGFTAAPEATIERITAAYSGSETSAELVLGTAAVAAEAGCGLRVASFFARPRTLGFSSVGLHAEDVVFREWAELMEQHATGILAEVAKLDRRPSSVGTAVGAGATWAEALRAIDWKPAEVLLVGSSSLGPLARISLGSHAVKIVRHSPVPVVVVPRRATGEYIAQAQ